MNCIKRNLVGSKWKGLAMRILVQKYFYNFIGEKSWCIMLVLCRSVENQAQALAVVLGFTCQTTLLGIKRKAKKQNKKREMWAFVRIYVISISWKMRLSLNEWVLKPCISSGQGKNVIRTGSLNILLKQTFRTWKEPFFRKREMFLEQKRSQID